jgi:phage/plasmid-like protein (TIGR03299 family)
MPANIDSMFYVGETPWHGEGTSLDKPPTIEEALKLSGLNWQVEKLPTFWWTSDTETSYAETGHFITVRMDTNEVLGHVGNRYEILQNVDAFSVFEPMLDMGFELETAGAVDQGRKVWVLAKAPQNLRVGDDMIKKYVLLYTSHDGSSGSCWRDTAVRTVCQNTIELALKSTASFNYQLRHTESITAKVNAIRENLISSEGNFIKAIEEMSRWQDIKMDGKSLDVYLETVVPFLKNRNKVSQPELGIFVRNNAKPVYDKMVQNFYTGKGNKGETLWDAYNAVTEYYTHDKDYKDWVKQTQFGVGYNYNVKAFKVAEKWSQADRKTSISIA